ncbi:MAG TPA: type IV secretory system conjugative DNA transfer family protein [Conexibacter sp.]|jgi:type IV secretion system protein VirD4|nr:type IV secretory system conjugative DNA transfer family protein [Conexibacter sp.]
MSAGSHKSEPDIDPVMAAVMMAAAAGVLVVLLAAVEWPVFVWSTLHARPMLLDPIDAIGGGLHNLFAHDHFGYPRAWRPVARELPPRASWITLDITGAVMLFVSALAVGVRLELWKGRPRLGLRSWDPRAKLTRRAWARTRDLLHLQRPELPELFLAGPIPYARAIKNRVMRLLAGKRRMPDRRGGDTWPSGVLHGTWLWSGPELHQLVVAPTGSGKTRWVVTTALVEHDGAAVVLSNKTDVYNATARLRDRIGQVGIFAPKLGLDPDHEDAVRWTPLRGCEQWEQALDMARWIYEANPHDRRGEGAEFYDKEATEILLPALLHAAALAGLRMRRVYEWLGAGDGVLALDEPAEILAAHTLQAAAQLRSVQHMHDRQRGFTLTAARQCVAAYQHPSVCDSDADEFDVEAFIRGKGTLYLVAPEADSEIVAPLFGGLIGQILRACEERAQHCPNPRRLPLVKILADEAAHLAPLRKLPTYLAVSRSWGLRWMVVYQSSAQLRQRYGHDADAILANTLSKLYLGPIHDQATREELAGLLGGEVVREVTHTSDRFGNGGGRSERDGYRPKAGAEDLATLPDGHAVMVHRNDLPAIVRLAHHNDQRQPRRPR